jgi:hypothetical protein
VIDLRRSLPLLALLAASICGCGYRPLHSSLPDHVRRVRVTSPEPTRTLEPALPALLAGELVRQLGRAGVRASTAGGADAVLSGKLLSLSTVDSMLDPSGRRLGARELRLSLELLLAASDGRTLWRSGLLEVRAVWPMTGTAVRSVETSRARALQELAARAAEQAVELLTSGL